MNNLKQKLHIYKQNLKELTSEEFQLNEAFSVDKSNEDINAIECWIDQNCESLKLLWHTYFSDARTCFFVEAFNLFQNLSIGVEEKIVKYNCQSQAFTTYGLKQLSRNNFIDIFSYEKSHSYNLSSEKNIYEKSHSYNLSSEKNIIDKNYNFENDYNVKMYFTEFTKIKSFTIDNIELLKKLAALFQVDLTNYKIINIDEKIYLTLKRSYIIKKMLNGEVAKNMYKQRIVLLEILRYMKNYVFADYLQGYEEDNFVKKRK